jgi:hypothetical protein
VRKVRFADQLVRDASLVEIALDGDQPLDIGDSEDDGEGARGEISFTTLACGVNQLSGDRSKRKICSHNGVVIESAGGWIDPLRI